MRRAVPIILVVALLVALDITFNGARITDSVYGGVLEFVRVATRTLTQRS